MNIHLRKFSKYYLYYTIDDLFSPETKMTGNDHDRK